jgi:DNA integrity scanning protein DisA with diadenylate cyclase activity
MPLNQSHRSDYYFGGADGRTRQFSRKQSGELLANIDEAEDQIRDYYSNADENYQIVEGLISSVPLTRRDRSLSAISVRRGDHPTTLFSYKVADNGFIHDEHAWDVSASLLYAWLFRLEQCGVVTYYTENLVGTARLLVAIYNNCQKSPEEHSTLQRYIKPRITIKEQDPFVKALMALSLAYNLKIGEDRATKIAKTYRSILAIAMAEVDELCEIGGIGRKTAENLLVAIGREL